MARLEDLSAAPFSASPGGARGATLGLLRVETSVQGEVQAKVHQVGDKGKGSAEQGKRIPVTWCVKKGCHHVAQSKAAQKQGRARTAVHDTAPKRASAGSTRAPRSKTAEERTRARESETRQRQGRDSRKTRGVERAKHDKAGAGDGGRAARRGANTGKKSAGVRARVWRLATWLTLAEVQGVSGEEEAATWRLSAGRRGALCNNGGVDLQLL